MTESNPPTASTTRHLGLFGTTMVSVVTRHAFESALVVLDREGKGRRRRSLGRLALEILLTTTAPVILLGSNG